MRYSLQAFGGYNLIWSDYREEHRLAEGKTAGEAWRNAAKNLKANEQQAQPAH